MRIVQTNIEIPPLLLLHQEVTEVQMLQHLQLVKVARGALTPDRPLLHLQRKTNAKRRINRPPPHTDDPIAMFSRYGVLDVEGGGGSDAEYPPILVFIMSTFPHRHKWNQGHTL